MSKKIDRRKFFGLAAFSAIGATIIARSPLKFIDKENRIRTNKKVKLHSAAVKRTK